jgi:hypothetical protein
MGRPINNKHFGANAKDNIRVQFHNGTASVAGAIVKQKGSKKFQCVDATGKKAVCRLVAKANANLQAGEMSITVKNDAGIKLFVTKMSQHKITVSNGTVLPWTYIESATDGKAQIEEAGDDATFTNNTDLT